MPNSKSVLVVIIESKDRQEHGFRAKAFKRGCPDLVAAGE